MDSNDIIVSWSCTYAISHEHASPVLVYIIRLQASKSVSDHQILIKCGWKMFPSWTRRFSHKFPSVSGWWYTYPSKKWWASSGGMMTFPMESHKIPWFQSTKQILNFPAFSHDVPMIFHGGNNGTAGNSLPIPTGRTGEAKSSGTMFQSLLNWSWDDVPRQ